MYFSSLVLAVVVLPVAFVAAQSDTATSPAPTSTAGISPCILQCVQQASSSAGCSGVADLQCLCTSSDFQSAAASCLESSCSADDLAAGQALQQQQCASISSAGSSAASSASSEGISLTSEGSSAIESITSAASSALSSAASSLSSRVSSAGTAASSAASEAASNPAVGSKVSLGRSGFVSGAIGILGVGVGALLV